MKTLPPEETPAPGRSWRRIVFVVIWLTALVPPVGAFGYFLYTDLLNPRITLQTTGAYDGFYWDFAQVQCA